MNNDPFQIAMERVCAALDAPPLNACADCRWQQEGMRRPICMHPKALHTVVRYQRHHTCDAMRAGICWEGALFEPNLTEKEGLA